MRAWQKGTEDSVRERYLGEIAPLLAAAQTVETLSAAERDRLRKQILRSVYDLRSVRRRIRLTPVLAGLALLVVGGMAFATAERLGLIRGFDRGETDPTRVDVKLDHGKYRGVYPTTRAGAPSAVEPVGPMATPSLEMPATPSPEVRATPSPEVRATPSLEVPATPSPEVRATPSPEVHEPLLGPVTPAGTLTDPPPGGLRGRHSPVTDSPVMVLPVQAAPSLPATVARPARRKVKRLALASPPAHLHGEEAPSVQPALRGSPDTVSTSSVDEHPSAPRPVVVTPVFTPASSPRPSVTPKPAGVAVAVASDQGLFGQAMRKLRWEHDPAAALEALQDHGQAYPNSMLSSERSLLEVEALLALHRNREALVRLDAMTVEDLPRSGERFVVRGELRASAQRWLEASADFDQALARVSGSPSWHERALWGRAVARLHCGEREAGMADMELYRDTYPQGRFTAEVAKFFRRR